MKQKGSPRFIHTTNNTRVEAGLAPILIVLLVVAVIGGYFVYQNKVFPNPQQTSQTSPTASPALTGAGETVNWKTYTNEKRQFLFKYHPNLYVKKGEVDEYYSFREDSSAGIHDIDSQKLIVSISEDPTLLQFPEENKTVIKKDKYIQTFEKTTINGYQGLIERSKGCPPMSVCLDDTNDETFSVLIQGKGFVVRFDADPYPPEGYNPEDETWLDQILSTFKFLDK